MALHARTGKEIGDTVNKLKIGDLVCFNSGGMKHKTLGIIMDFDFQCKFRYNRPHGYVLIMWSVVGKYMPRTSAHTMRRTPIESGEMVWHELGDWIVEVK